MKLMVLSKNKKLGYDNSKWSLKDFLKKLKEEFGELEEAIGEGDNIHIAEEVLDVIQACVGMMYKLFKKGLDIEQLFHRHNKKLVNREWKYCAEIKIQVNKR